MEDFNGGTMDLNGRDEVHDWPGALGIECPSDTDMKIDGFTVAEQASWLSNFDDVIIDKKLPRNRDPPLQRLRAKLQMPEEGMFDRFDINWDFQRNSGWGGKSIDTMKAIIPWDRLEDFVGGEENMRDFPCTFTRKKYREVEVGSRSAVQARTPLLVIRFRCSYGPNDKTGEVQKDIETLFANALKSRSKACAGKMSRVKSKTGTDWVVPSAIPEEAAEMVDAALEQGAQVRGKKKTRRGKTNTLGRGRGRGSTVAGRKDVQNRLSVAQIQEPAEPSASDAEQLLSKSAREVTEMVEAALEEGAHVGEKKKKRSGNTNTPRRGRKYVQNSQSIALISEPAEPSALDAEQLPSKTSRETTEMVDATLEQGAEVGGKKRYRSGNTSTPESGHGRKTPGVGQKDVRNSQSIALIEEPAKPSASDAEHLVSKTVPKQNAKQRRQEMSWKRGCQAYFVAKQLYLDSSLFELQYHCCDHVNKDGKLCHGSSFGGHRIALGTNLSKRTKEWIEEQLRRGLTPPQVMAEHKREVRMMAQRNEKPTRDTFIMPHDVLNIANKLAEELWQKHNNDAISVRMWTEENPDQWFFYKEHESIDLNEAPKEECTYTLGIQTGWQKEVMLMHGHKALSMDATFGTNDSRYPLYTLLVFDEWQNGIPVAYIITSRCKTEDIHPWLSALNDVLVCEQPSWKPNAVIVDCAQAELNAIEMVWPETKIMLCLWHVRKAWAENVCQKIKDQEIRLQILQGLAAVMYTSDAATGGLAVKRATVKFRDLQRSIPQAIEFWTYFEKQWMDKMSMWVTGYRNVPHANQDTNAAVENYHNNMKSILRSSRSRFVGRRMDWLIFHLVGDVLCDYWYGVQCKLYGFIANKAAERLVASAVLRARMIPDHYVSLNPGGLDIAFVTSVNHYPEVWTVLAPDKDYAQCNCPHAERGNICKHVIKVFKMKNGLGNEEDSNIIKLCGTVRGTAVGGFGTSRLDAFHNGGLIDSVHAGNDKENTIDLIESADKVRALKDIFTAVEKLVVGNTNMLNHALAQAKVMRGKLLDLQVRCETGSLHPSQSQFRPVIGDNSLKR